MTVLAEMVLLNMVLPALMEQVLRESLPMRLYLLYRRNQRCSSILETLGDTLRPEVTEVVLLEAFSVLETLGFWM